MNNQFSHLTIQVSDLLLSNLERVQSILQGRLDKYLFLWLNFFCIVWFPVVFLFFWGILCILFNFYCLIISASYIFIVFFLSAYSDAFLYWVVLFLVFLFSYALPAEAVEYTAFLHFSPYWAKLVVWKAQFNQLAGLIRPYQAQSVGAVEYTNCIFVEG